MSSLQDLLNQYSQDISARVRHQDDVDQEIQDRKAQSIQEKYQQVRDHFESAANDLMGAGAAIHMGRKVYNKWAARNATARQSQKAASDNANDANATAGDRPTGPTGTATDDPEVIGARLDNMVAEGAPEAPTEAPARAPIPKRDLPEDAFSGRARKFQNRANQLQENFNAKDQNATEAAAPDDHIAPESNAHAGAPAEAAGAEDAEPLPEVLQGMGGREATPLQATPDHVGNAANVDNPTTAAEGSSSTPFSPEDIEDGARAFQKPGAAIKSVGATSDGAVDGSSGALDTGINGAKSVLKKAGGSALEGMDSALPEVSGVLDALGPIGEIFGVLTSIAGAIEGATSQDQEKKEIGATNPQSDAPVEEAGTGVDVKALAGPASQAGTFTA